MVKADWYYRAARAMWQTEEGKQFFFAKKNQKTFVYVALAFAPARTIIGAWGSGGNGFVPPSSSNGVRPKTFKVL